MKEFNNIEELFKSQLQNHEVVARPELWDRVASSSGINKPRFSTLSKIAAASLFSIALGATVFWFVPKSQKDTANVIKEEQDLVQSKLQTIEHNEQKLNKESESISNSIKPETKASKGNASKEVKQTIPHENATPKKRLAIPEALVDDQTPQEPTIPPFGKEQKGSNPAPITKGEPNTEIGEAALDELLKPEVLDLEALHIDIKPSQKTIDEARIAPNKEETTSLEQIHFPEPFAKIFNPNIAGESGCFSAPNKNLGTFKIEIRNRSGKMIYKSIDPNFIWKGEQMDGSLAPEGTYVYSIFATTNEGDPLKPQIGSVFLMRK